MYIVLTMLRIFQAFVAHASLSHAAAQDSEEDFAGPSCFSESKPQCSEDDWEVIASTKMYGEGKTWYNILSIAGVAGMGDQEKGLANLKTQVAEKGLVISDTCLDCQAMSGTCGFWVCGFQVCAEPLSQKCLSCGATGCALAKLCGGDPKEVHVPVDKKGTSAASLTGDVTEDVKCASMDGNKIALDPIVTTKAPSDGSSKADSASSDTSPGASSAETVSGASLSGLALLTALLCFP